MDISKMLKRATGELKYTLMTIVIGLTLFLDLLYIVDVVTYGAHILSLTTYLLSFVGHICLLVYALNSHGTRGMKLSALAYFGLSAFNAVMTFIVQRFVGVVATIGGFGMISIICTLAMLAFVFLGIRGLPVIAVTVINVGLSAFSLVMTLVNLGVGISIFPMISTFIPVLVTAIAGYLVATDKK